MSPKFTASSIGLVLASSLLITGCEDKKETPAPDQATAAKSVNAKETAKTTEKKADKPAAAKTDQTAAATGSAGKDGKAGSCGKGSCG